MTTNGSTDAARAHIDAETLAAWADHGLPAAAAAAVELHLSNCDRCQEVLAALVRSEPVAGAAILPFWARRPVQWSAAGLAAAAALVAMVWIGEPASDSAVQQRERPASAELQPTLVPPQPEAQERMADNQAPVAGRQVAQAGKRADEKVEVAQPVRSEPTAVATPAATVTGAVSSALPPPPVAVTAAAPVVGLPSVGAPANTQIVTMAESVAKAPARVIEIAVPEPSAALASRSTADVGRAGGGAGRGGARFAPTESTAPVRWRIIGGTRIERTDDSGVTWIALPLQPGLTTPLLAGTAASPFVCWFVGSEGVVLLSTDGRTLRRVSLPESVVLTSVTAVDGMRATVTAADGRKFSTVDGGLTWK